MMMRQLVRTTMLVSLQRQCSVNSLAQGISREKAKSINQMAFKFSSLTLQGEAKSMTHRFHDMSWPSRGLVEIAIENSSRHSK